MNPDYILPSTWEELLKVKISDNSLDKLYMQSKVEKFCQARKKSKNETKIKEFSFFLVLN